MSDVDLGGVKPMRFGSPVFLGEEATTETGACISADRRVTCPLLIGLISLRGLAWRMTGKKLRLTGRGFEARSLMAVGASPNF